MRRRDLLAMLGGTVAISHLAAAAQEAPDLRLALMSGVPRDDPPNVAMVQRLTELGYVEGRNRMIDWIEGADQFRAETLLRSKPTVIYAPGIESVLKAALAATRSVPIVMLAIAYDPVALGYATSLARPVGNVTGLVLQQIELTIKRLQLVKEAFPDRRTATMFWDAISADQWRVAQNAAGGMGLRLEGVEFHEPPYDYEQALASVPADARGILIFGAGVVFYKDRQRLADFAMRHRAISVFWERELVDVGGLMSYGPSITGLFRRAAEYIDRIARGAKPSELPIEQPTKFELVINLKTAKALGVAIPSNFLARADDVIE